MTALLDEEIKFCPRCGEVLSKAERSGRTRPVCSACGWIFFPDPKVATAGLIIEDGQVLLVRRANDPQRGLWTLPAGFVDAGEDPAEAMKREVFEETGLNVRVNGLFDVLAGQEHDRGAHILIVYRAEVNDGELKPGDDVDQASYFSLESLPELAFSTTNKILSKVNPKR